MLFCLLISFAHPAASPRAASKARAAPVDPFDRIDVVEKVGQAISEQDDASAAGTDVAFEVRRQQPLPPMAGWITVHDPRGWTVRFIRADLETPTSALDIRLGGAHPEVTLPSIAGEVLPADQAAMWRARQLAIRTSPPRCGQGLNPVVLSASLIGQSGWLVYLLNPATRADQIVIGGHVRVHVSQDGNSVLETTALSRSCLTIDGDSSSDRQTVAAVANQVDGETPHETTVSESLRSKKNIDVVTHSGKKWKISGGRVTPL